MLWLWETRLVFSIVIIIITAAVIRISFGRCIRLFFICVRCYWMCFDVDVRKCLYSSFFFFFSDMFCIVYFFVFCFCFFCFKFSCFSLIGISEVLPSKLSAIRELSPSPPDICWGNNTKELSQLLPISAMNFRWYHHTQSQWQFRFQVIFLNCFFLFGFIVRVMLTRKGRYCIRKKRNESLF